MPMAVAGCPFVSEYAVIVGGANGDWKVDSIKPVTGESVPAVARMSMVLLGKDEPGPAPKGGWQFMGKTSSEHYEYEAPTGAGARRAAVIPLRKSTAWWSLSPDERRSIIERSSHIGIGLEYIATVARRLVDCRQMKDSQFDFVTWFEYGEENAEEFEELVRRLRASEEWTYVEREVDIRLSRE